MTEIHSEDPSRSSPTAALEPIDESDWGPRALDSKRLEVREHQAQHAAIRERWMRRNGYFYRSLRRLLRFIIEPGKRVLNIRSQTGLFLADVEAARGVGVELSQEMVDLAREKHPEFEFVCADPETVELDEKFDYILLSDVSDIVDVLGSLSRLHPLCEPHTRLVIYTYNLLWHPLMKLAERVGLRTPSVEPNWLSEHDLKGLLTLSHFQHLQTYDLILFPKWIPVVSEFFNRVLARLPGLRRLCMIKVIVARPDPVPIDPATVSVSVIVPCKNERGNIESAVRRVPSMGKSTELIFCDDKSTDGTADEVRRMQQLYPERDIRLVDGPGICKAKNVWTGFGAATGDVLMILDADLTVMPEELPYFFEAMVDRRGEFINGSRLVYPLRKDAMKYLNMQGNKAFSMLFSYLLDQRIKDTLCGTKVLWRKDWKRIEPLLGSWGVVDLWGDYELLFGAARRHLAIIDLPVHYQERLYGATKMVRVFRNGLNMLRMCVAAGMKLKGGF